MAGNRSGVKMAVASSSVAAGAHHFAVSGSTLFGAASATALVTLPWWRTALRDASEMSADVAPIVGVLIGLATLYHVAKGGDADKLKNARLKQAGTVADAVGTAAKRGGATAAALIALAAVFSLLLAWIGPKREAIAAPVPPSATKQARRRPADDAGEDGPAVTPTHAAGAPPWFVELRALVGTHEGTKRRPNPVVQAMFADSGFPQIKDTTGTAWCAAAVNAVLERAGVAGTKSLAARSFEKWGDALDKPRIGCVVVMWRGSPKSWMGHVGLYAGEDATHVHVLGGNQSDAVTVARFPKSRVLTYRWPRPLSRSKTIIGAGAAAAAGAASVAKETVEAVAPLQEPLSRTGDAGASVAVWIGVALAVVSVAGALYAIYGRRDARNRSGV